MEILNNLKKQLEKNLSIDFDLKVIANSSSLSLEKMDDILKLKIRQVPEKGKANQEIIAFFKKNLKPLKVEVEIKSGQASNLKKIKINLLK